LRRTVDLVRAIQVRVDGSDETEIRVGIPGEVDQLARNLLGAAVDGTEEIGDIERIPQRSEGWVVAAAILIEGVHQVESICKHKGGGNRRIPFVAR